MMYFFAKFLCRSYRLSVH